MAMMPCKECGHQISDRAASCPSCGAPVATPVVRHKPRFKRIVAAVLLLVGIGAVIWMLLPHSAREQVTGLARGATHDGTPAKPHDNAAPTPVATKAPDLPPPLYSTTAEQLYQDYSANVVATQSRIGGRRIRISGNVTEIDEDDAGHPLVKMWSGNPPAGSAEFRLNDDQKAAAAELVKGQAVDIECGRMQHAPTGPEGSGCSLVPVDLGVQQAYLAVAVSEDHGQAPIYIVGPMPRSTCLTRSDTVSAQLAGNIPGAHIVSKQCSATAQENLPSGGCRLDSSMSAVPDMPAAHLWKYECVMPDTGIRPAKASAKESRAPRKVAVPTRRPTAESDSSGEWAEALPPMFTPVAEAPSASSAPAVATAAPAAAASIAAAAPATDSSVGVAVQAPPTQAALAIPDVGPATPIVAGTASPVSSATPAPAPAAAANAADASPTPSELISVKAKDPGAADHIASYCNNATAAAANHDVVAAGCRRDEVAAWNRMVVQNEFPSLDDASRQKCSQAPFPDSYVAKEVCAKYQLRVN